MHRMKRTVGLAAVLMAGAGTMVGQSQDWAIDKSHSEADFSVKHMGISTVHGSFRVEATVDVNTIDTGVGDRDKHLKSADFFEVEKYSTMTFESTSVKPEGSGYLVAGDLTLHGVTKPVELSVEAPGNEQVGMDSKSVHRGFTATTKIDREDFGLKWNGTLKSGDAVIGSEVKIELDIEAVRQ